MTRCNNYAMLKPSRSPATTIRGTTFYVNDYVQKYQNGTPHQQLYPRESARSKERTQHKRYVAASSDHIRKAQTKKEFVPKCIGPRTGLPLNFQEIGYLGKGGFAS